MTARVAPGLKVKTGKILWCWDSNFLYYRNLLLHLFTVDSKHFLLKNVNSFHSLHLMLKEWKGLKDCSFSSPPLLFPSCTLKQKVGGLDIFLVVSQRTPDKKLKRNSENKVKMYKKVIYKIWSIAIVFYKAWTN